MVLELNSFQTLENESCHLGKLLGLLFLDILNLDVNLLFYYPFLHLGAKPCVIFWFWIFCYFYCYTWICVMKSCSKLLSIFMSFLNEIRNQFGKVIKILRSNNAKEYFSSDLFKLLSSHDILQHLNKMVE